MKARKGSCKAPTKVVLQNIRSVSSKVKRASSFKKKRFRKSKRKKSRSEIKSTNKRSRK